MINPSRLLIVNDNKQFAKELKKLLQSAFPEVEIKFAVDGKQAWKQLRQMSIDLVISSWELPLLSGGDLLLNVRGHYQTRNLPFMMLTTRSDRISVIYALRSGVTAYIKKPFDRGFFIERTGQLLATRREEQLQLVNGSGPDAQIRQETLRQRSVEEVLKRLRNGKNTLPVLPEIVMKLNKVMSHSDTNLQDIIKIISKDSGLTSKLISISNSIYYRGIHHFNTLEDAVIRLGFRQTQNYVHTFTTRDLFVLDDPFFGALLKKMWIHSIATAAAARSIAQHIHTLNQDILYTKGLMHDIGKLLLIHTMAGMPESKLDDEAIYGVLDTMHTEYGAALLSHWHFSSDFNDICLCHHDLGEFDAWSSELLAVSYANILVRELGWSLHEANADNPADHEMAQRLGLSKSDVAMVLEETHNYVNEAKIMIWDNLEEE